MDSKAILKRSEVAVENTWDLSAYYASDEDWRKELAALKEFPEKLAAYAGRISVNAADLLAYFRLEDETEDRLTRLYQYASCKSDEDTSDSFYQDFKGKAMGVFVAISSASAFSTPEILTIGSDTLESFFRAEPGLEEYRRKLYLILRCREHVLSPECEALLASAGEMSSAPDTISGIFRDADLTFPEVTGADGNSHPLTDGTLVPLLMDSDRVLRRNTFETYYRRMGEFRNTTAAFLDAQFKQLKFFSCARKYGSALEASLDAHEIPTEVYTNLIAAVHANLDKMYRYVALRKKMLNVEDLHMYDVYTPIVADADAAIPYEQAKATVLDALQILGDDYTAILREAFGSRWIDRYPNVGKRSGAYSTGTISPHPFVLLNHKDNLDSQFTLAHELGHAVHSYLSCRNQPVSCRDYVIFVAEVASTCNEVLVMRYLLDRTEDKKERAYLINHFLDQFKGTLYRQTMFAEFELEMGTMCENGETITADALCEKYLALNKLYFGPDMISDEEIALEWSRIPHFFYDYYVFQYATGFSAAVAIANRILKEGAPAVADYLKFLSGGCSTDPISLLKIAGVDMSTPAPVNEALRMFGELIDELEKLL